MKDISRRSFLQTTVAGSALLITPAIVRRSSVHARPIGANDDIRVAVAGLRIRGPRLVKNFTALSGVRVVAVCDPDTILLNEQVTALHDHNPNVAAYQDIRKLLEQKDIDVLAIATPNHWHALMAIWAIQAGKDVYVEKPVSHSIWEGRKLVQAARKSKHVVQAGLQSRSDEGLKEAFEYIWNGNLGRIKMVRGFCYKRRESIGKVEGPQPIPKTIDYDLWTGPAPLKPLLRKELHYDWHWVWDTGNGDIGNQGPHELDMCRWVLRKKNLPRRVMSFGGRYGYIDDGVTPNTLVTYFDYDTPVLFEVRGLSRATGNPAMDDFRGIRIGIVVECEDGYFAGGGGGGWAYDQSGKRIKQFVGSGGVSEHVANFIQAVRNHNPKLLNSEIQEGHVSSALCHLGNISYRLGHSIGVAELEESFVPDIPLADELARFQGHLRSNDVDLSVVPITCGPSLEFIPKQEKFVSAGQYDTGYWANLLLKDDYRPPYVFPEIN